MIRITLTNMPSPSHVHFSIFFQSQSTQICAPAVIPGIPNFFRNSLSLHGVVPRPPITTCIISTLTLWSIGTKCPVFFSNLFFDNDGWSVVLHLLLCFYSQVPKNFNGTSCSGIYLSGVFESFISAPDPMFFP